MKYRAGRVLVEGATAYAFSDAIQSRRGRGSSGRGRVNVRRGRGTCGMIYSTSRSAFPGPNERQEAHLVVLVRMDPHTFGSAGACRQDIPPEEGMSSL